MHDRHLQLIFLTLTHSYFVCKDKTDIYVSVGKLFMKRKKNTMFYNEINLTRDIIREYQIAFWNKRKGAGIIRILIILIFILASGIVIEEVLDNDANYLTYLLLILPFLVVLVLALRVHNEIKTEYIRMCELNHGKNQVLIHKLSDQITCYNPTTEGTHTIEYSQIIKVIDTKNLIILLVKGNLIIPLKKNGFREGTWNDAKGFILKKVSECKTLGN